MSNIIEWPGTAGLSEEPTPEPRDPIEAPWCGDVWEAGRYRRTYDDEQLQGVYSWRPPRKDEAATHIRYRTGRWGNAARMTIPKWRAWCRTATLIESGADPLAVPPLDREAKKYGAISYTGGTSISQGRLWRSLSVPITYQMEWGSVRMNWLAAFEGGAGNVIDLPTVDQ